MKILAVNGSPRGKDGNTEQLLQPLLNGARGAGADVEVIYLKDKKINHCQGCFACWFQTPGVCVHQDDMPELLEKKQQADVIVYATPLYVFMVTGIMKDFMDRSALPLALPSLVKYSGRYGHPMRYGEKTTKVVLISNCGVPDRNCFSGMMETFRILCSSPFFELAGAILCSAGAMLGIPPARKQIQWYLNACEVAGREVIEKGGISPETQAVLDRELTDPETYSNFLSSLRGTP